MDVHRKLVKFQDLPSDSTPEVILNAARSQYFERSLRDLREIVRLSSLGSVWLLEDTADKNNLTVQIEGCISEDFVKNFNSLLKATFLRAVMADLEIVLPA